MGMDHSWIDTGRNIIRVQLARNVFKDSARPAQ
jgi:hypothetical protein